MQAQAERLGLVFLFDPAIEAGRLPDQTGNYILCDTGPLGHFGVGDQACTLSHIAALESFLDSPQSCCLMLEDDARLAEDASAWLGDLDWVPEDADVVKLEAFQQKGLVVLLGKSEHRHLARNVKRLLSRHTGAAGYLLTRKAAEKILNRLHRIDMPIDHLLFNLNISPLAKTLCTYQVLPALIRQDPSAGGSDIAPLRIAPTNRFALAARELRRGMQDVSSLPAQLVQLIARRATLTSIDWVDECIQAVDVFSTKDQ